jgi:hypothetical protein
MNDKNQEHIFCEFHGHKYVSFDYRKFGILGVGRNRIPMVNMDPYIDHSMDEELHTECCIGLAQSTEYKLGQTYGAIPEVEQKRLGSNDCWSELMRNLEQYDPDGKHKKALEYLVETTPSENLVAAFYKYAYFAMNAPIPWFFALYLKHTEFRNKTKDAGVLTPAAERFPKLMKYIDTLPFKSVGRILFFTTYPNAGVMMHRDSVVAEHQDHNINLFFTSGRPSYVWDEIKNEKTYLDPSAKSYYFNNRDYHGVDAETAFRYTVRIDGTFTDEMQEKLGLEDGYTWRWDYETT